MELEAVIELFRILINSVSNNFPPRGQGVNVTAGQGVYIIFSSDDEVLHVGKTNRGQNGLKQRLNNETVSYFV